MQRPFCCRLLRVLIVGETFAENSPKKASNLSVGSLLLDKYNVAVTEGFFRETAGRFALKYSGSFVRIFAALQLAPKTSKVGRWYVIV